MNELSPAAIIGCGIRSTEIGTSRVPIGFGLYAERGETIGFGAVVQMLQVADEAAEEDFAERVLQLVRKYFAVFVSLLGNTTESWVRILPCPHMNQLVAALLALKKA
jgi:hypothetical protein